LLAENDVGHNGCAGKKVKLFGAAVWKVDRVCVLIFK